VFVGALQLNVIWPLPALAVSPVGAPGGVLATGEAVTETVEVAVCAGDALSVTVSVEV
jgi:hypothetical protein